MATTLPKVLYKLLHVLVCSLPLSQVCAAKHSIYVEYQKRSIQFPNNFGLDQSCQFCQNTNEQWILCTAVYSLLLPDITGFSSSQQFQLARPIYNQYLEALY